MVTIMRRIKPENAAGKGKSATRPLTSVTMTKVNTLLEESVQQVPLLKSIVSTETIEESVVLASAPGLDLLGGTNGITGVGLVTATIEIDAIMIEMLGMVTDVHPTGVRDVGVTVGITIGLTETDTVLIAIINRPMGSRTTLISSREKIDPPKRLLRLQAINLPLEKSWSGTAFSGCLAAGRSFNLTPCKKK